MVRPHRAVPRQPLRARFLHHPGPRAAGAEQQATALEWQVTLHEPPRPLQRLHLGHKPCCSPAGPACEAHSHCSTHPAVRVPIVQVLTATSISTRSTAACSRCATRLSKPAFITAHPQLTPRAARQVMLSAWPPSAWSSCRRSRRRAASAAGPADGLRALRARAIGAQRPGASRRARGAAAAARRQCRGRLGQRQSGSGARVRCGRGRARAPPHTARACTA